VASIDEDAIVAVLQSPLTMVASDGGIGAHPKSYGTRARILGHYVRDRKLLSLQEAVRRMTSLPAERLRLSNRGSLKANSMADIVVFDPDRILSTATRARPTALTEGVRYLFINGRAVIFEEVLTNERPGRVVHGPAWQEPDRSN
jgi:N-acyl-D-aspartate/D-glutamate deacylase